MHWPRLNIFLTTNSTPSKQPIRWKRVVWMNLLFLGGCILAIFTIPRTTRLSVFGFSCLVVVIALNAMSFGFTEAR
jgi:hypothetical protein